MISEKLKNLALLVANLIVVAIMVVGYQAAYSWITQMYVQLSGTVDTVWQSAYVVINRVLSMEKPFLMGAIFTAAILSYDIIIISRWLLSFRFTRERACNHCGHKLIREHRQRIDRFISRFIPVKRYRCVGCSREYLMVDKSKKKRIPSDSKTAKAYQPHNH
jgi:DNA-directed RNA polymerase subunit RPC12/RpoP